LPLCVCSNPRKQGLKLQFDVFDSDLNTGSNPRKQGLKLINVVWATVVAIVFKSKKTRVETSLFETTHHNTDIVQIQKNKDWKSATKSFITSMRIVYPNPRKQGRKISTMLTWCSKRSTLLFSINPEK